MNKIKEIYDLAILVQDNNYKREYEQLKKENIDVGTLQDYIDSETEKFNEIKKSNKEISKDIYLFKDTIQKENTIIDLYLIKYLHTNPVELDEDYKVLPLKQEMIYEYGVITTMKIEEGNYSVNNIFGGKENVEQIAIEKYTELKNKIELLSEEQFLEEVKNSLLDELKD
ncbi:MAG: hypothetical protein J6B98_04300 [Bacilli bacterium]|nr:hypothetical protein [Bacilli bacterium]